MDHFPGRVGIRRLWVSSPAHPLHLPPRGWPTCGWRGAFTPSVSPHLKLAAASKVCALTALFLPLAAESRVRALSSYSQTWGLSKSVREIASSRKAKVEKNHWLRQVCFAQSRWWGGAAKLAKWGGVGPPPRGPEGRSVGPHDHRFHLLRGSPVFHQEVDHALGLNEEVAAEEEDAEDHGEREHAHDGDLHHAHDVQAALVRAALGEAVVGHHGRLGAAAHRALQCLTAVGQEQAGHIRLVTQRGIHRRGGRAPGRRWSEGWEGGGARGTGAERSTHLQTCVHGDC